MLTLIITALVLVATFLQTKLAAKESGDAHRAAMDVWNIEDELGRRATILVAQASCSP